MAVHFVRLLIFTVLTAVAVPAGAQSTSTFSNTTSGTINGTTVCTTPLVRTFAVGNTFMVADVNVGDLRAFHFNPMRKAKNGGPGRGSDQHGEGGADCLLKVPLGTVVQHRETGEMLKIGKEIFIEATETLEECHNRFKNDKYDKVAVSHINDIIKVR
jgi:hypothetical protein